MFLFSCCCLWSCLKATEGPNIQLQHKHCFSYSHISCHHPNKHAWLIKKIIIVPSLNNNNWILTLSYLKYSIGTFTQHWIYWWINRCLPCEFTIKLTHIFFTCLELKKNWLDNLYTLTPVSIRRNCVMVFKCLNNLVPKYLANIFLPRSHIHTRTMQCTLLHIPCCWLSYGQHSFTYCGCRLWNCISNDLKAAGSVNSFRCHLAQKLLSSDHLCWV